MAVVRRVFALSALSALVVAGAPAVGGAQTVEGEALATLVVNRVIGAADGLFVDIQLVEVAVAQESLTFGPAPSVVLPPEGGAVSDEIADVDEEGAFIFALSAALVSVAAEGALGPDGFATADTAVADLLLEVVDEPEEPPVVAAELITATCEADLDGVSASTTLVGAEAFGEELDVEPEPNTVLDLSIDGVTVTALLNGQEENPDGSLSVVPLALLAEDEFGSALVVEVGPATCGVVEGAEAAEIVPVPDAPAEPLRVTPRFTG